MREQDGESEPAHHARRPMNAFLIFCKRHRSVVRDKYPNLENRSITKILGEWWANLDKEEKACYTGLAKQYKDAFFNANPDFKWYKLPAPPLRTLSSRPRDTQDKEGSPTSEYQEEEVEKINNNSTEVDLNSKPEVLDIEQKSLSMFTPGKLADEAQMGGLSSLLSTKTEAQHFNPYYSPPQYKTAIPDRSKSKTYTREDSIIELQNELSQTTRMFEHFDDDKTRIHRQVIPNELTNQDVIDQIVDKRYSKEDDYDDDKNTKSGRSCKGKRYQEFMAVGGLMIKRQKRDNSDKSPDEGYNASCSWEPGNSQSEDSLTASEPKQDSSYKETSFESEVGETGQIDTEINTNKSFKAADFDLDAKIRALPSLSLEKFQQKKRENKRKKKTINFRPKSESTSANHQNERKELVENWRQNVIGSQKRKPRKISITRLEINSLISSVDIREAHKISPQIKIATEAPTTVVQSMDLCKQQVHNNVDLFALATLAEVASNTSKIEEATILGSLTTKSEDHASKV